MLPGKKDRREPVFVLVAAALSISAGCAVLLTVASPSSDPAVVEACHGSVTPFLPPSILTPSDPVLLPRCAQFSVPSTTIEFSVQASVDLRGSWVSSYPLAVGVYNATTGPPPYGEECPACWSTSGILNITLFPGTYNFGLSGPGAVRGPLTAVQPIVAEFDRGLTIVAPLGNVNLSPNQYSSWPVLLPINSTGFYLEGSLAATGCGSTIAILPLLLYHEFQANRSAIDGPSSDVIAGGYASPCPDPNFSSQLGPGAIGPLELTSGSRLVALNTWLDTIDITVLAPIEISYLPGT